MKYFIAALMIPIMLICLGAGFVVGIVFDSFAAGIKHGRDFQL